MGKSTAKLITASDKVKELVDRGYEVDVEIKNLGFEDSGIKKLLSDELGGSFEGITTVRVEGENAAAVVSQSERYKISGSPEDLTYIEILADKGYLGKSVKVEKALSVPYSDIDKAKQVLKNAGIDASVLFKLSVSPADYRALKDNESASAEETEAYNALSELIERSVSYRVKYEKV
jgi:hypothetical protein